MPKWQPGQIVVLDNVRVHTSARTRALIEAADEDVASLAEHVDRLKRENA